MQLKKNRERYILIADVIADEGARSTIEIMSGLNGFCTQLYVASTLKIF